MGAISAFHRWHPVAEENVDVLVLHGSERNGNRQNSGFGFIAQAL